MRNKKKIIIIVLCMAVLLLAVVYAAFATKLTISSKGNITSNWNVYFASISSTATGQAYNIETPSVSGATARFRVGLKLPGDKMTYRVKVTNGGTVDAYISDVKINNTGSTKVITTVTNSTSVRKGGKLVAGRSGYITIDIQLDPDATSLPDETVGDITIELVAVQYTDQEVKTETPIIETKRLNSLILRDNTAQPDTDIDFSQGSSASNGRGLYYTNTNTENNAKTYYFRGAVENNYVSFAGLTWRIIRINEDESIRIISKVPDDSGDAFNNALSLGEQENAYVGFMYGTTGASTYNDTHKNVNSSTIKVNLDAFYYNNLKAYSTYLADAGFCGDRSISSGLGYGDNVTYYGAYARLEATNTPKPQFKCPQTNDLYTTTTNTKGNKNLTYPIGLITIDEVVYAGGVLLNSFLDDSNSYLTIPSNGSKGFWTMTPRGTTQVYDIDPDNYVSYQDVNNKDYVTGIYPVINLKATTTVKSGTGTASDPYVIE